MTFTNGDVSIPDAVLDVAAVPPVVADACAHGVARHAVEGAGGGEVRSIRRTLNERGGPLFGRVFSGAFPGRRVGPVGGYWVVGSLVRTSW